MYVSIGTLHIVKNIKWSSNLYQIFNFVAKLIAIDKQKKI